MEVLILPKWQIDWFDTILQKIEKVLVFISGFALTLMMFWISADAIARYILNKPIPGTFEFNEEYLMIIIVYFALSYTYTQGGHVRVTLFLRFFPMVSHRWLEAIGDALGAAFFILLIIASWGVAMDAFKMHVLTNSVLRYPIAPALFIVPLGSSVLTLRVIQSLLENIGIIKRAKHEQVEFAKI